MCFFVCFDVCICIGKQFCNLVLAVKGRAAGAGMAAAAVLFGNGIDVDEAGAETDTDGILLVTGLDERNPCNAATDGKVSHVDNFGINSLRSKGEPICSNYDGYFYADNQHEISATIAQLTSRIQKIAKARDGLVNRTDKED